MNKYVSAGWGVLFLLFTMGARAQSPLADTTYILLRVQGATEEFRKWDKGDHLLHQLQALIRKELHRKELVLIAETDTLHNPLHPVQQVIYVNLLELLIQEPAINQLNRSVSREITANNYSDETEDLRKQHAMVYADLVITEKSVSSLLRVTLSVIQLPEASTRWNELFAESYTWESRSATYTGSIEALSAKETQLVRTKPRPVPAPAEIYKTLIRQWLDKASHKLGQALH